MSLFLLGFSIAGQRNETEAANNTASTFMEYAHIIDHTFRLHKCACANIKVGVAAKLRREKFNFECVANERRFEDSNLFPSPSMYILLFLGRTNSSTTMKREWKTWMCLEFWFILYQYYLFVTTYKIIQHTCVETFSIQ